MYSTNNGFLDPEDWVRDQLLFVAFPAATGDRAITLDVPLGWLERCLSVLWFVNLLFALDWFARRQSSPRLAVTDVGYFCV